MMERAIQTTVGVGSLRESPSVELGSVELGSVGLGTVGLVSDIPDKEEIHSRLETQ